MSKQRPIDSQKNLERLERKHQRLKARVAELDSRAFLSASEQVERVRLKKQKLATKDMLVQARGYSTA
jgi:uncharacterized protein YdcH (DUF465 family)